MRVADSKCIDPTTCLLVLFICLHVPLLYSGLYRAFHKRVQHKILKSILSRASFSISDSVNDLVYYQLLMW